MKTINDFIIKQSSIIPLIEKLKINSKSKINTTRYLSKDDVPKDFMKNFSCKNTEDLNKIEKDVDSRKQTPQELIDKVTYKEQLFCYWYLSLTHGWEEACDIFRQEIIDKGYATDNELDAEAIDNYNTFKFDSQKVNYILKYLDKYDVKMK